MRRAALFTFIFGLLLTGCVPRDVPELRTDQDTSMEQQEEILSNPDNNDLDLEGEETVEDADNSPTRSSAVYIDYAPDRIAQAAQDSKVILFFHAAWCPTCRALDQELLNNLDDLPINVTILKVDYDKETELKDKYEVTYQHTLVQVDETGTQITKWNGGGINEIIRNLE